MQSKISVPSIENPQLNYAAILKGTGLALVSAVSLVAVSGTVLYYAPTTERWIPLIALGIFFCSVLFGGFSAARKARCKGLFHGLGVGILFLFIVFLISLFLPGQLLGLSVAKKIVSSVLAGLLGGIWGVGNQ